MGYICKIALLLFAMVLGRCYRLAPMNPRSVRLQSALSVDGFVDDVAQADQMQYLAGYFDAKGTLGIIGGGIGLKCTFQKFSINGTGTPKILDFIRERYGGKICLAKNAGRQGWKLEYTNKAVNIQLLTDLLPHLQIKRRQVEAALLFLACDSRSQREEKVALGNILKAANPRAIGTAPALVIDEDKLSAAYIAGLMHAVGCFEFYEGTIRITCRSLWLSELIEKAFHTVCPEYESKSIINPDRGILISSTKCYVFLLQIREEMDILPDDPRAQEADTLITLYELCGLRGVTLSPKDLETRSQLVNRLRLLKQAPEMVDPTAACLLCLPLASSPSHSSAAADAAAEEEALQNELHFIEAIEQRNEAQLLSFIDAQHQWESQSQEDRDLLAKKSAIVARLEEIRSVQRVPCP